VTSGLGQAKVTPRSGNDSLGGDVGAFVNVVCQAASDEYDQRVDAAKLSAAEVWAFVLERERKAHVFAAAQIGSDRKRQQDFMDRELELRSKAATDPLSRSPEQMWADAVALATSMLLCFPGNGPGAPHLEFTAFYSVAYRDQAELMAFVRRYIGRDEQRYMALFDVSRAAGDELRATDPEHEDDNEFRAHITANMLTGGAYPWDA